MHEILLLLFIFSALGFLSRMKGVQELEQLNTDCLEAVEKLVKNPGEYLLSGEHPPLIATFRALLKESWFQGEAVQEKMPFLRSVILSSLQYYREVHRMTNMLYIRYLTIVFFVILIRVLILHMATVPGASPNLTDLCLTAGGCVWILILYSGMLKCCPGHWFWDKILTPLGTQWIRTSLCLPENTGYSKDFKEWNKINSQTRFNGIDSKFELQNSLNILTSDLQFKQHHRLKKWEEHVPLWELVIWSVFVFCTLFMPVWQSIIFLTPADMT